MHTGEWKKWDGLVKGGGERGWREMRDGQWLVHRKKYNIYNLYEMR